MRNLVIGIVLVMVTSGFVVLGVSLPGFFRDAEQASPTPVAQTVNRFAKLTANGDPVPTDAREDVVVTVTFFDSGEETNRSVLDYATSGNWRISDTTPDGRLSSSTMQVDGRYYLLSDIDLVWDEVPESAAGVDPEEISNYVLNDEQLDFFNRASVQLEDELCSGSRCSVWESQTSDGQDTIIIRVLKDTRKIYDVSGITTSGNFIATYSYQDVNLSVPESARLL
ncbi:MAG: hypothetical protein AAF413_00435 [Patescibacteria group bacterium]